MAKKKALSRPGSPAKPIAPSPRGKSTVSGPARKGRTSRAAGDELTAKMDGTNALAAAMPFNPNKPGEYGKAASIHNRARPSPRPRWSPAAR